MKISVRNNNNYQIYDIEGNIDLEETHLMEEFIYEHKKDAEDKIAINLESVPYFNSSTLGALVRILQTIKKEGKELVIYNLNKDLSNLFTITGVNRYFTFVPTEADLK